MKINILILIIHRLIFNFYQMNKKGMLHWISNIEMIFNYLKIFIILDSSFYAVLKLKTYKPKREY